MYLTDAAFVDDVGHLSAFQQIAGVHSFMVSTIAVLVRWLKMDAEETSVLWLDRNAEEQAFEARPGCAR